MKVFELVSGEPIAIKGWLRKKLFILMDGDIAFREIPFITGEQSLKLHATDIDDNGDLQEVNGE